MNRKQRRQVVKEKVTATDLKRIEQNAARNGIRQSVTNYSIAVGYVLRDKLGFGKTRIHRTLEQIQDLFDSINKGYVNIDDLRKVLKDEVDVEVK